MASRSKKKRRASASSPKKRVKPASTGIARQIAGGLRLHQNGDLNGARQIYETILKAHPNIAEAHHLLGAIHLQSGDNAAAVMHIQKAIHFEPSADHYYTNLSMALSNLNRHEEAIHCAQKALTLNPQNIEACLAIGQAASQQSDFEAARQYYQKALAINPKLDRAYLSLGNLYRLQGNAKEALAFFEKALAANPRFAGAYINMADLFINQGHIEAAIDACQKALEMNPTIPEAYTNMGLALQAVQQTHQALENFQKANRLAPNDPVPLINMGNILQFLDRAADAVNCYQKALALNPNHLTAIGNMAELTEKSSQLDDAATYVQKGLALDPQNLQLNLIAAKLERRQGQIDSAIERLERLTLLTDQPEKAAISIHFELGGLYERRKEAQKAFQQFSIANKLTAMLPSALQMDKQKSLQLIEKLSHFISQARIAQPACVQDSSQRTPIFLVGFPRSGTTLLEQILDSHPEIQAMEEKPIVETLAGILEKSPKGYPEGLGALTAADGQLLRENYFQDVRKFLAHDPSKTVLDKYPLNIIHCALIQTVFPQAKFILAIRHPLDVCLSCYMQNFIINSSMVNFLTLAGTARYYEAVMGLWNRYTENLPINYSVIRYEDLVDNVEGETRKLFAFLDIPWDASVLDFHRHAKSRGWIRTPSYHQVTDQIYQRAKYRWERYRIHLERIMPELEPFIEQFGYEAC